MRDGYAADGAHAGLRRPARHRRGRGGGPDPRARRPRRSSARSASGSLSPRTCGAPLRSSAHVTQGLVEAIRNTLVYYASQHPGAWRRARRPDRRRRLPERTGAVPVQCLAGCLWRWAMSCRPCRSAKSARLDVLAGLGVDHRPSARSRSGGGGMSPRNAVLDAPPDRTLDLAGLGAAPHPQVNLLPPEVNNRRALGRTKIRLALTLGLVLVLLVGGWLYSGLRANTAADDPGREPGRGELSAAGAAAVRRGADRARPRSSGPRPRGSSGPRPRCSTPGTSRPSRP